ncbi:MAG: DUF4465 domain-containing protein [Planctomycetota bacterium]
MNHRKRSKQRRRLGLLQCLEDRRMLAAGPFAPPAGQDGTTAISLDDPRLISWAAGVADYSPGSNVDPEWTDTNEALGPAEGQFDSIVALGRGGSITLTFDDPIRDGLGDDFAVFENSFSDNFLELGFVEVSSNGVDFVRFPNDSLTAEAVGAFGELDATNVNGLAGKYRGGFGVPFDLEVLADESEIDVSRVTHVRLVDIVGDGNTLDSSGDPIFDPYPTTGSAGLDVDGVGVINSVLYASTLIDFESAASQIGGDGFANNAGGGDFQVDDLLLNNDFNTTFGSWSGWSLSQTTNTVTPGFGNQYSAFPGSGASDSATYAVGYYSQFGSPDVWPTLSIRDGLPLTFESFEFTNTTYAALSMRDGDAFAKQFGGPSGQDPDTFRLIVESLDVDGNVLGESDAFLADYRPANSADDFILDQWTSLDVRSWDAAALRIRMESTDVGQFGINTPTYVAVDNVRVRRPSVAFDVSNPRPTEGTTLTGRVTRGGRDTNGSVSVSLTTDADNVSIPAVITIPDGQRFAEFSIELSDDERAGPTTEASITASIEGIPATTRDIIIEDDDASKLTLTPETSEVREGQPGVTFRVERNSEDIADALTVTIVNPDSLRLSAPLLVTIPAGQSGTNFVVEATDDDRFAANEDLTLEVMAEAFDGESALLTLVDNDVPTLSLSAETTLLDESNASQTVEVTVERNLFDLDDPLLVELVALDDGPVSFVESVTIPAFQRSVSFLVSVKDDMTVNASDIVRLRGRQEGFLSGTIALTVIDNDQPPGIRLSIDRDEVLESDGDHRADFEDLSPVVPPLGFRNNAGESGEFVSGGLSFSNSFDNSFGFDSWSGFALSKVQDSTTPGFFNQYAAFPGAGAESSTYAVSFASSPSVIQRDDDSGPFESLAITNTTYAALSMLNGDAFAKKFGGESGDDEDFFRVTITGRDRDGESTGEIEVFLADYRFENADDDFILDDWLTIDLTGLADATSLSFALDSTDVGQFGMNTPAYFAIDNVTTAATESAATLTVERIGDNSESATVALGVDDSRVWLPQELVFEPGMERMDVPVNLWDDAFYQGNTSVTFSAVATQLGSDSISAAIVDNEERKLSLVAVPDAITEEIIEGVSDGAGVSDQVSWILHRNDAVLTSELSVGTSISGSGRVTLPSNLTIPADDASVLIPVVLAADEAVNPVTLEQLTVAAEGYPDATLDFDYADNDTAGIQFVSLDTENVLNAPITVMEFADAIGFGVRLSSQPTGDVNVALSVASDEAELSASNLVFTPVNWDSPQVLTVNAIPDFEVEETLETLLLAEVVSAEQDDAYRMLQPAEQEFLVMDGSPGRVAIVSSGENGGVDLVWARESDPITLESLTRFDDVRLATGDGDQEFSLADLQDHVGLIVVDAGTGDDQVWLDSSRFTYLDGGAGMDELAIASFDRGEDATLVDLGQWLTNRVVRFEVISILDDALTDTPRLLLDSESLDALVPPVANPLQIDVYSTTTIDISGRWTLQAPTDSGDQWAQRLVSDRVIVHIVTNAPWQNAVDRFDVDASGNVSAVDALRVINRLNSQETETLDAPSDAGEPHQRYYDVSGDGRVTALDALQIINRLNDPSVETSEDGSGEPITPEVNRTVSNDSQPLTAQRSTSSRLAKQPVPSTDEKIGPPFISIPTSTKTQSRVVALESVFAGIDSCEDDQSADRIADPFTLMAESTREIECLWNKEGS